MSDIVLIDIADGVATLTLNRPEARNALSSALKAAIVSSLQALDSDDAVAAIVITGADPAFCAGLDLKELGSTGDNLGATSGLPRANRGPFPDIAKPIIGAVNGVAVTGGLELALNCDFLIASDRARFADTHTRVGVQPGWGLTVLLPQAIGIRRAREMSFTGNFVGPQQALEWGLVNHVVEHTELLPFSRKLAADIASNDPAGVQFIRSTYARAADTTADEGWRVEEAASRKWTSERFTPEEVERRRLAVMERGRGQG